MVKFMVSILELQTDPAGQPAVLLECPAAGLPRPGQYLQINRADSDSAMPVSLFPSRIWPPEKDGATARFIASIQNQDGYRPGKTIPLRGPLGNGFTHPAAMKRLALAALDASLAPLLPLMDSVLDQGGEVAVFCDALPDGLPEAVEINPLDELGGIDGWADFTALTCSLEQVTKMDQLGFRALPAHSSQVLVRTAIPCGGLADCGVCAVPAKRGYKLVCKDGPVFAWNDIRE